MKVRTLVQLIITLAILGGWAYWSSHRKPAGGAGPARGSRILPVGDLNAIATVQIISGTQQVTLARSGDAWRVEELWRHPANFDQLASLLRALADLKVGEVIRGGIDHLDEFGLLLSTNGTGGFKQPALIRLTEDAGTVTEITVGQPRATAAGPGSFSMPDSQYVRVGSGPVLLAAPLLEPVARRGQDWLNRQVVDLPGTEVSSVTHKRSDGSTYGVSLDTNGVFSGSGSLADQPINGPGASQWMGSLQGFTFTSLADPKADRAPLGLDRADVTTLRTKDGLMVTATVGGTNELGERYALFSAEVAEGASTSAAPRAAELNARLQTWTYLISANSAQSLAMLREQLIAATSATNAPLAAPSATPPGTP